MVHSFNHAELIGVNISTNDTFMQGTASYMTKQADTSIGSIYGISYNPVPSGYLALFHAAGVEQNRWALYDLPNQRFEVPNPGEIKIGNYLTRANTYYTSTGDITITPTAGRTLTVLGNVSIVGQTNIVGSVNITGDINITGNVTINGVPFATHQHDLGGGVTTGGVV